MADLIARTLVCLCSLLFPARGKHRATPAPAAESPRPLRPLPDHKSPYAREAAERRAFVDEISPVRPYVLTEPRERTPKQMTQAVRRWAVDMATRGIDVGPTVIHGVHVRPGTRTLHVAVGA